jgi:hypothetical protein
VFLNLVQLAPECHEAEEDSNASSARVYLQSAARRAPISDRVSGGGARDLAGKRKEIRAICSGAQRTSIRSALILIALIGKPNRQAWKHKSWPL